MSSNGRIIVLENKGRSLICTAGGVLQVFRLVRKRAASNGNGYELDGWATLSSIDKDSYVPAYA
jgi:hypothetical protein